MVFSGAGLAAQFAMAANEVPETRMKIYEVRCCKGLQRWDAAHQADVSPPDSKACGFLGVGSPDLVHRTKLLHQDSA
jgi:hypothetical protein